MDRRSFLIGTCAISSQLLLGCSGDKKVKLKIELLKDSLPTQVVDQFRRTLKPDTELNIALVEQIQDTFKKLETWQLERQKSKPSQENNNPFEWISRLLPFGKSDNKVSTDLLTLGDFWLRDAIEKKLIQPIDVSKVEQWSTLPKQYQALVTRNEQGLIDPKSTKIWGAPYRWGNTIIVYRRDKFDKNKWAPLRDWNDLWREELSDRISLLDHPREVIGLVLKRLNQSYNTQNLASVPELEGELKKLNKQVKFYGSTKYIEPLLLGDTLVAVGWSQDILPTILRYPSLAAIIPQSGTAQSADIWVSPTGRQSQQELLQQWINFLLKENITKEIAALTKGYSPITNVKIDVSQVPEQLRDLLVISPEILNKSEFIHPLPLDIEKEYTDLFERIKISI